MEGKRCKSVCRGVRDMERAPSPASVIRAIMCVVSGEDERLGGSWGEMSRVEAMRRTSTHVTRIKGVLDDHKRHASRYTGGQIPALPLILGYVDITVCDIVIESRLDVDVNTLE